jgi:hypothetical protein
MKAEGELRKISIRNSGVRAESPVSHRLYGIVYAMTVLSTDVKLCLGHLGRYSSDMYVFPAAVKPEHRALPELRN